MDWNLEEALNHYRQMGAPGDQNALVALLKEIQRTCGGIPARMLPAIAEEYGIRETLLLALIRRLPSLRLADTHVLEICAGPNCSRRDGVTAFAEKACAGRPDLTLRLVPCMRQCGKGPNIKFDGKLYHQADEDLIRRLLQDR